MRLEATLPLRRDPRHALALRFGLEQAVVLVVVSHVLMEAGGLLGAAGLEQYVLANRHGGDVGRVDVDHAGKRVESDEAPGRTGVTDGLVEFAGTTAGTVPGPAGG